MSTLHIPGMGKVDTIELICYPAFNYVDENMGFDETIILSLGGSLIVPDTGIDVNFLKNFNNFVRTQITQYNRRFIIVAGGGATARSYRDAGNEVIGQVTKDDLDWLGIHATRINAHLIRTIFKDIAHKRIIDRYDRMEPGIREPVIVAAGWKPGWSTDYCAVLLAKIHRAKVLINLSNVNMVYTADPRKDKNARPIERTTWKYFCKLIGSEWTPGMNVPWDPIAAREAKKLDLTVIVLRGTNIQNIEKLLTGKKFIGTVISPFTLNAAFYNREYYEEGMGYHGYTTKFTGKLKVNLANIYRALMIKIFLNPKSVLDVGCATGHLVHYLRLLGVDAKGIEISKYVLSRANPRIKGHLAFGDILDLPYESKSFDTVVTYNVLSHIELNDLSTALKECSRVSKRYCLHKVFTTENWWMHKFYGHDISQVSVYSRVWWKDYFRKHNQVILKKFFPSLSSKMETIFLVGKRS